MADWRKHVSDTRAKHAGMSYSDALKEASKSWTKKSTTKKETTGNIVGKGVETSPVVEKTPAVVEATVEKVEEPVVKVKKPRIKKK